MITSSFYNRVLRISIFISLLLVATACPQADEPAPSPGSATIQSTEVEEVSREENGQTATYTMERNSAKDKYTKIKDDLGNTSQCKYSGSKMTLIQLDAVSSVNINYNTINKVGEVLHDFGVFRLRGINSYSEGNLNRVQVYNELQQPDSSYNQELTAELSDVDVDETGGTMVFTTYIPGNSPIIYDVVVSCLSSKNNLRNNTPFAVMFDFTDQFYNYTNQFEYCVSGINMTNRADNSQLTLSYQYKFDSKGRITQKTQTSSQSGVSDIVYGIEYFSN